MAKRAALGLVLTGTVQPGHYLVLVAGDVASVEEAVDAARNKPSHTLLDEVLLPDIHPDVVAALKGGRSSIDGEALGVVETSTVAALLLAADRGIKGAKVGIREINIADGLGGKAYVLFGGTVSDVEVAVEVASSTVAAGGLVGDVVIASLAAEMEENLGSHPRFGVRSGRESDDATS